MSLPNSVNAPVEKQRFNIYTMMLILSFLALVTACVLMAIQWNRFDSKDPWNTNVATPVMPPQ